MKAISYASPETIGQAVQLLSQQGERARVLSGGTDVIVQVEEGRRDVDLLVDVKRIEELNQLSYDPSNGLELGAAVPCWRICADQLIAQTYPGLIDAVSLIGGVQIQSRASVGGNLCNASPAADAVPALIALGGRCVISGPEGTREVPVEKFCTGPGRTVLGPCELLVTLRLPPPDVRSGAAYLRFIPRNEMDIAVVGVGAALTLDGESQKIRGGRVALAAVAPTPLLVEAASSLLADSKVSDETFERVAAAAQEAARPISDMRGSAGQRRHLVGVLTRRVLHRAIDRARTR